MIEDDEEYVGSMTSTSFNQPGNFYIEPLDEKLKCIKVTNKGGNMKNYFIILFNLLVIYNI